MSWPQWPGGAGVPQPGIAQSSLINPAPNVMNPAAAMMSSGQYTPEQWAQMQQQNWQQWAQWQQQFQQWQQQYGAEYQKSISAMAVQSRPTPVQPPVPFFNVNTNAPPPLPAETKPPPPPDEPQLGQSSNIVQYPTFTSAPPPIPQPNFNTAPPPQPPPPKDHFQNQFNPNQSNAPSGQSGFPNRNINEGFKGDNQQRFGGNQSYLNNSNRGLNRNVNWQNQNNRNQQSFGDNRFNQPPGPGNDARNRGDFGGKRSFNQPNDGGDPKRNKLETDGDGNKWQGNQQKPKWEAPPNQPDNQRWGAKPAESAPKQNPEELSEAEKKFDRQFADWESQFQKWKEQNANHPDKDQYREYEKKWEAWRSQLLDRREQMRRKRLGLTSESPHSATDKLSQPKSENEQEKLPGPPQVAQTSPLQSQVGPQAFPLNTTGKPSLLGVGPQTTSNIPPLLAPNTGKPGLLGFAGVGPQTTSNIPPLLAPNTGKPGLLGFGPDAGRLDKFGKKQPLLATPTANINLNRLPPSMNDQPLDFKKSHLEFDEELQQAGSELLDAQDDGGEGFLKPASTGGIPGLDLVKDGKEEAKAEEESENQKRPDLEAISRGINSILGDQKLMNMLSMVSQTPNQPTSTSEVNTVAPITLDSPKFSPEPAQDDYSNQENVDFYENPNDEFSNMDEQTRSSFNIRNDAEGSEFDHFGKSDEFGGGIDFNRGPKPFSSGPNNFNAGPNNWNTGADNFNRGPDTFNKGPDNFNKGPGNFNRGPDNFNRGPDNFNRGPDNFNRGPDNFNRGPDNFNRGPDSFNRGPGNFNRGPDGFNRGPDGFIRAPDGFNKGPDGFNRGPDNVNRGPDGFNRGPGNFNRGPDNFNRGPDNFNRGLNNFNRGPDNFNKGPDNFSKGLDNFNKGPDNFNKGPDKFNKGPDNFNKGPDNFNKGPDNFNKGPDNFSKGPDNFSKGPDNFSKGPDNFSKGPDFFNRGPDAFNKGPDTFNRGPDKFKRGLDNFNRGPDNFNRGPDNFNKGPGNFNRGPDNFNLGPDNFRGSDNFNRGSDNFNRGGPDKFARGPDNFNKAPIFNKDSDNFEEDPDEFNFNKGPDNFNRDSDNFNKGPGRFNRGPNNFGRNSDGFNRGSDNFDRGPNDFNQSTDNFNRDTRGSNNFNKGPDNFGRGTDFNIRGGSNRDFEDESDMFDREPDNFNRGPEMGGSFDEESNSFDRERDDYSRGSQNVDKSGFNRGPDNSNNAEGGRFEPPPNAEGGRFEPPPHVEWNRNNSLINDPIPPQTQELTDKNAEPILDEDKIWKPSSTIDYDHKTIKPADPDVIVEPVYAFDYRHKPFNRIPFPQRPQWLLNMVKNYPEFDSAVARPFEQQVRRYPVNERFDARSDGYQKYDDRGRKFYDDHDRKPFNDRERVPFDDRDRKSFNERERAPFDDRDRKSFVDHSRKPHDDWNRKGYDDHNRKNSDDHNRKSSDDHNRKSSDNWDRKSHDNSSRKPFESKFEDRRPRDFGDRRLPDDQKNMFSGKKPYGRDSDNFKSDSYMEKEDENPSNKDKVQSKEVEEESFNTKTVSAVPSKSNVTIIEDLLCPPGRYNRPPRVVIILRGPPGSGKSFLAKLIKDKEVENGGSAPRILCLDDYFMVEQEKEVEEDGRKIKVKEMIYEFEECMEASYRLSLMKSFKKTITDGYFNFIIVDNINDKVKYFGEMWSFAKQNGFQVYISEMELDVQTCTKRNIHGRSEIEIERCVAGWEPTPAHHPVVDATGLIQSGSISEVEMEEINSPASENMNEEPSSMAPTSHSEPPEPWKTTSNWTTTGCNPFPPNQAKRGFDGLTWKNTRNKKK